MKESVIVLVYFQFFSMDMNTWVMCTWVGAWIHVKVYLLCLLEIIIPIFYWCNRFMGILIDALKHK